MDDIAANLKGYCHCDAVPGVKCAPCRAADEIKRLTDSERYAWKNTREIDAERMKFREALQSIADESYNDSAQIKARRALSAEGDSK